MNGFIIFFIRFYLKDLKTEIYDISDGTLICYCLLKLIFAIAFVT